MNGAMTQTRKLHLALLPKFRAAQFVRVIADCDSPFDPYISLRRPSYRVCAVNGQAFEVLYSGAYRDCLAVAFGY